MDPAKADRAYRRGEPLMTDWEFDKALADRPLPSYLAKTDCWPAGPCDMQLKYDGVHVICKVACGKVTHVFTASGLNDVSTAAKQSPAFHRTYGSYTGDIHGEALYCIDTFPEKTAGSRRAMAAQHLLRDRPESEALWFVPWSVPTAIPYVIYTGERRDRTAWLSDMIRLMMPTPRVDVDGIVLVDHTSGKAAYKGPVFRDAYKALLRG